MRRPLKVLEERVTDLPLVSIVIPCRNERQFIGRCLDSIVGSDYPKEHLEVLVADGFSEDGTTQVLEEYVRRHSFIRVLPNPDRVTPAAFNTGVANARGDLVMIMSAHAEYAPDAIRKSVEYSRRYRADNVGGVWHIVARGDGVIDRGVVAVLGHPFGVGGGTYRTGLATEPTWVDTAAYGCYRREVFDRVGRFNPRLVRGQDMEFNRRLHKAGGRTLLAPDVIIRYHARTDFQAFWRHSFRNGVWAVLPFLYSPVMPVGWRHLVPLAFVGTLGAATMLGLVWTPALQLATVCALAYAAGCAAATLHVTIRRRDGRLLLVAPPLFAVLHFSYGLGSWWGIAHVIRHAAARLATPLWRRPGTPPAP